jgi:DNA-binding GntR family transcriptional regulator
MNAYDITSDVYTYLNVPGRRVTPDLICHHVPASVAEIEEALRSLEVKGLVRRVRVKGWGDGIVREMWKAR